MKTNQLRRFIVATRVCLIALVASLALPAEAALTAQWGFNESSGNVASNSVSPNNGIVVGGVSHVTGQVGKAYQFDGSSGYVNLGTNSGNFGTGDFSVSYWMRTTGTRLTALVEKRPACNMDFGSSWWDVRVQAITAFTIAGDHNQNMTSLGTSVSINDGLWHHLVWERSNSTLRLYLDGVFNGSTNIPGVINVNNSTAMRCAISSCDFVDSTIPYAGALDELQLFNHALSAQEVKVMYDNVIANLPPDCSTLLAQAQAQLALVNATNVVLRAQLLDATTLSENLQAQLNGVNQAYTLLQSQYGAANNLNTYYVDQLMKIAVPVTLLSSNYAIEFNSPGFKIPGVTLELQVSNIVYGIQTLDQGSQSKLFKLWSPRKTTSGF